MGTHRTLKDRFAESQNSTVEFWRKAETQKMIREAVDHALKENERLGYPEGGVEVAIVSNKSVLTNRGVFDADLSAIPGIEDGKNVVTYTSHKGRKGFAKTNDGVSSKQLTQAEVNPFSAEEVIEPPWNFAGLQKLHAENTMHASAIETKSSDYAYSGWRLELRPETVARINAKKLDEDFIKRRKEDVESFLSTCAGGSPIEDICRDTAIEFEALGTSGLEGVRNRSGMLSQITSIPFRTVRYLDPRAQQVREGNSVYVQIRNNAKRYFVNLGDNVVYSKPMFDPRIARFDEFPVFDTLEDAGKFVAWKTPQQLTNSVTGLLGAGIDQAAGELFILPRRPFTLSDIYGTPAGIQALPAMKALKSIQDYNLQFFEAKGVPQYAVIIKGLQKGRPGVVTREGSGSGVQEVDDIARLTAVITEYFTNRVKQSDRSVLVMRTYGTTEIKFERLSAEKVEASFAEYEQRMKEDIRMSHRMPPAAMGINEDTANIGSGRDSTQMRRYRDHIVIPGQRQIASMVNTIIRVGLLTPYFEFKFNPIDLNEEQAIREFLLESYRNGVIELDEMRKHLPGSFPAFGKDKQGTTRMYPGGTILIDENGDVAIVALDQARQQQEKLGKDVQEAVDKNKPKKTEDKQPTKEEEKKADETKALITRLRGVISGSKKTT